MIFSSTCCRDFLPRLSLQTSRRGVGLHPREIGPILSASPTSTHRDHLFCFPSRHNIWFRLTIIVDIIHRDRHRAAALDATVTCPPPQPIGRLIDPAFSRPPPLPSIPQTHTPSAMQITTIAPNQPTADADVDHSYASARS